MNKTILIAVFCISFLISGCSDQQRLETRDQIHLSGTTKAQAMLTAQKVLKDFHFDIDKADYDAGFIQTKPLTAGQWFEFWRKDNVGSQNIKEANIQTIRRTVHLEFADGSDLLVMARVFKQRLNMPEREIAGSEIHSMFSRNSAAVQTLRLDENQIQQMTWTDLGRDKLLETDIINSIRQNINLLK